jgi:EF-P beta-lysylation protein EpmB
VVRSFDLPWPDGVWRDELAQAITDPAELLRELELDPSILGGRRGADEAARRFPLRVPRGFVARMRHGDPNDPLLAQVLPVARETDRVPGFTADPVGEHPGGHAAGMLRKYRGRALLVTTPACAVHCRYCFRRQFPYDQASLAAAGWERAVAAVADDPTVAEVILSGGDPLTVPDGRLAWAVEAFGAVDHVRRLRIHTRVPVVLPERVDGELLEILAACRPTLAIVLHVNHAHEIDDRVRTVSRALAMAGAVVLNQAVLLAGVNDTVDALEQLSTALVEAGIVPYYLHLLDRVDGAAHFDIPERRARELLGHLLVRAPGYLVPRLVREVTGAPTKIPIAPILP